MSLFGSVNNAANSPAYVLNQLNVTANTNNQGNLISNLTASVWVTNVTVGLFGVTAGEQTAKDVSGDAAPAHSGWVLRTEGTGGRAGRVTYETIVAGGSMAYGAASENVAFPDYTICIVSQPSSNTWNGGNSVVLTVSANTIPSGGTLTYRWQADGGAGVENFANVANGTLYTNNTSPSLTIANNANVSANTYRCVVYCAAANTTYSANATVTAA